MLSQLGTRCFVAHQLEQNCSSSQAFSPQPESIEAGLSNVVTIFLLDHDRPGLELPEHWRLLAVSNIVLAVHE